MIVLPKKPAFKLGIIVGTSKGDREFVAGIRHGEMETDIMFPLYAVKQFNDYIHENYDKHVGLYFGPMKYITAAQEIQAIDEAPSQRRKSRKRE